MYRLAFPWLLAAILLAANSSRSMSTIAPKPPIQKR